jgi:hypothetical protein
MSPHPCDGHSCDHCYLCDVVGICCMTITPQQREQLEADDGTQRERLRTAIVLEAGAMPSLGELVRRDAERWRPAPLLSSPSPFVLPRLAAEHIPNDSRKEAIHVLASRPTR